jgi:AmmeMemoRadiSam system protein B
VKAVSLAWPTPGLRLTAVAAGALVVALAIALAGVLRSGNAPQGAPPGAAYAPSHPLVFYDARVFAAAEAATAATPVDPMPGARGLLLPHDWVAGDLITTPLRDLAASRRVTRVILIGPNHVNAGGGAVLTSDLPWQTPFGPAEADRQAVVALAADGSVRVEPEVLTYEHSVAGIVPAVRRYLPQAKVVPLVLRGGLSAADVQMLAAALAPLLGDGTVVVAAVDFSHGLPAPVAHQRDGETLSVLRGPDWSPLLRWGNEHVDSPASVAVLMEIMSRLGAGRFELRANRDSGLATGDLGSPVTSYLVGYFH